MPAEQPILWPVPCSACRVRPADVAPGGHPPICAKCLPAAVVAAHGENTARAVAEFLGVVRPEIGRAERAKDGTR